MYYLKKEGLENFHPWYVDGHKPIQILKKWITSSTTTYTINYSMDYELFYVGKKGKYSCL
jgi:hypothetical protein